MKALIGVDSLGQCVAALDLVRDLHFPLEKIILQHSVESVLPDGSFPGLADGVTYTDLVDEFETAGKRALEEAATEEGEINLIEKRMAQGDPLQNLLDTADDESIDLIAVGSQQKSALQAMLMGSVTRGLLTASTHSFLAAKQGFRKDAPLTAVFATDHSDYSNRCADLLLSFAPKGIGRLVVVSVIDPKAEKALSRFQHHPEVGENIDVWADDRMERENLALCAKFSAIAESCEERVERGEVNHALRAVMEAEKADLLILGAQGHGFLERLKSGSVSFHQVVSEHYPVLVLRA